MSVLRRNASVENTPGELKLRPGSPEISSTRQAMVGGGRQGTRGNRNAPHIRTAKRMDQELGFSSGGITYFKVRRWLACGDLRSCAYGIMPMNVINSTALALICAVSTIGRW